MAARKKLSLSEALLQSLGVALHKHGFARVPKRKSFHRATSDGWWGIHAPITPYMDGTIVVALSAIIRFDAVEKLVLKHADDPLYVDGPNRGTLALFMTEDIVEGDGICTVERLLDLPKAVAWAELRCEMLAFPFFKAFPTLEHIYEALNGSGPPSVAFDFPDTHERAKRVLAAAFLLGHLADLPMIVARERKRLTQNPQASVAEFDDFALKVMRSVV